MQEASLNRDGTLMTVNKVENAENRAPHRRRDDKTSLSSISKEQKEDDSMVHRRLPVEKTRGATPPRPKGRLRTHSHDGSLEPDARRSSNRRRSASPNRIPRVPNKLPTPVVGSMDNSSNHSSPRRFTNTTKGSDSLASSSGHGSSSGRNSRWQFSSSNAAGHHEQALFEQRLCDDPHGVAVRKINQNGKPNLRYVKCFYLESDIDTLGENRSNASSFVRSFRKSSSGSPLTSTTDVLSASGRRVRVLAWGKKKDVRLSLDKFVCVRKGKTTERARRNSNPSCRILSLITTDTNHPSLDIEAPTRLDRDKFARAFARFLDVPLVGEDKTAQSISPRPHLPSYKQPSTKTAMSEPGMVNAPKQKMAEARRFTEQQQQAIKSKAPLPLVTTGSSIANVRRHSDSGITGTDQMMKNTVESEVGSSCNASAAKHLHHELENVRITSLPSSLRGSERSSTQAATASKPTNSSEREDPRHVHHEGDDTSQVSSLTGAGFDQEIVEELHQALTDLRAELEESRAEAARAVKVAEQAIQSAENSNSNDWNSTVTHKAAEAAALAQKKSAEAMSKQRLAEEKLEGERRTAAFWRRQAEAAEEEAGALQTRAAAAEVQRAALAEELESERRKTTAMISSIKSGNSTTEKLHKEGLEAALKRNRLLELELERSRRDASEKNDTWIMNANTDDDAKRKFSLLSRKKKNQEGSQSSLSIDNTDSKPVSSDLAESCFKLHTEAANVRTHFELLRKAASEELQKLPEDAKRWAIQASQAITEAQNEVSFLREKLALESATRRKLIHEVQDLRGVVRVYCRPRFCTQNVKGTLSMPSQETLLLHPYENESPVSFKFDRVFSPDVQQREVYNEIEELCLSVMDGYNVCLMAHGQTGIGKTYSMLGSVKYSNSRDGQEIGVSISDHGIHLKAVEQFFSISEHRKERYQDVFTLDIVEVYNERLCDLVAGTVIGETRGQVVMEDSKSNSRRSKRGLSADDGSSAAAPVLSNSHSVSSKQGSTMTKLEIRTNHNGDTVVQGLISVEVHCFEDVYKVWQQCLSQRANRLAEQGIEIGEYEASSHVIATLSVVSVNVSTGIGNVGKIKFVDLAGADLVYRRGIDQKKCLTPESNAEKSDSEWKYANRSLATLNDVINCRSQFMRSVPYRNSTLTHLLRDNLEADTKVLLLLCVSSDPKDLQETACALRFASEMRRVSIGKATKHSLTST